MNEPNPEEKPVSGRERGIAGDFSLRYLLEILFRRKRVFILPMILTPLLAVAASLLITAQYISSTTILLGKEEILNPLVRYETAVAMADTNRLGSFQKIVYSRPLLEDTIRKLGLDKDLESDLDMEKAVNRLRKNILLLGLTSDSFQIACTSPDAALSKNLVETVSRLFIEKSLQGSRREAMAAVNLIQKEVERYREEMERTEQSLEQFRKTNVETLGLISILGGQLNDFRAKGLEAELELKQERLNENLLNDRLTGEKPMVIAQALYVQNTPYQKHYQELQLQMSRLLATRDKSHPEVLKLQREMDYILRLLEDEKKKNEASETQEIRSPVYQEVSARLEDARIKIKVLEQKNEEYRRLQEETRKRLAEVPELEKNQARMQSDLKLTNEIYETLRVKLEQARITCEVEIAQQSNRFTIIDPPVVPLSHHKPNRRLFAVGGLVGGVCLGLLLAFLMEFTDPRVLRPGDLLRQSPFPMFGVVPKLYRFGEAEPFHVPLLSKRGLSRGEPSEPHLSERRLSVPFAGPLRQGLRAVFCAERFVMPPEMPPNLVVNYEFLCRSCFENTPEQESLDDYLERLRTIAVAARDAHRDSQHLLWMVTSARGGEGKSVLTANLATVMAGDLRKPVLLVDANLRRPSLSRVLGYPEGPGFAEVVEGRASLDEVLIGLDTPGLSLLPSGTSSEHPDVLYNSPAFRTALKTLRERFSFTLLEGPEMHAGAGGRLIASNTDGILFVVRLYTAKRRPVETALRNLPPEKVIGVVFNYFEYWIPEWLYKWV